LIFICTQLQPSLIEQEEAYMAKISYNTNGLRTLEIRDAIRAISVAGYDGVELSLSPKHLDVFSVTADEASELRRFIQDTGLVACCLATGFDTLLSSERFEPSLIHPTPAGRQRRWDALRKSIELGCALGVPVINFGSGFQKKEVTAEEAWDFLVEGVARCLEFAGGAVTLAIEPEPEFFIETNREAVKLIRAVGSPYFRLNQDIGHANVCEDDYLQSIADALPLTSHIHIEDIRNRVHRHEIPGDGDINFVSIASILDAAGYEHFVSVELYNHADVYPTALRRSLEQLRVAGIAAVPVS
jgi:hydroxypyruvate isomerase